MAGGKLTSISTVKREPSFSFPVSTVQRVSRKNVPGPGAYAVENNHSGEVRHSGYHFSHAARDRRMRGNAVGPGQYDVAGSLGGKAASIKGTIGVASRNGRDLRASVPGPGAYDIPTKLSKSASVFGSQPRGQMARKSVPGPGAYSTESSKAIHTGYSFGRTDRVRRMRNSAPGPGAYDAGFKSVTSASPAFSFRGRFNPKPRGNDVGPGGAYSLFA